MNATTCAPRFDFVSLGESVVHLIVFKGRRLEDTRSLDLEFAGVESNVSAPLLPG
jgi:hypothetical protein